MDTKLRTSFIPKKALMLKNETGGRRLSVNLFFSLGVIVFSLMVLVAVGAFLYKTIIQKQIAQSEITLEESRKAFEIPLIAQIKRLDSRISVSQTLLKNHIVVLPVFDALESLTLKTVRFNTLAYQLPDKGTPTITMNGEAAGYPSVALQSDSFGEDERVRNPIFSNLGLNEKGSGVKFSFKADIDPSIVSYQKYFDTIVP